MVLKIHKVVASLPSTLEPDAIYAVRAGAGFDFYIVDETGQHAHSLNRPGLTVVEYTDEAMAIAAAASAPAHQITVLK